MLTLALETDGGLSEFAMKPLDRPSGRRRKKVAVDAQGRDCRRALMTHDGVLLTAGAVAALYEDAEGNAVEVGDVFQTDANDNILHNLPATLGRPQRPVGPVAPDELLDYVTVKAYALTALTIARDLGDALAGGAIYRVACRLCSSTTDAPAFLLGNEHGIFLLQCKPCLAEFVRHDQPVVLDDGLDDEEDPWDDWPLHTSSVDAGDDPW